MNKYYTLTVGGEDYKLRFTASSIMETEKKLGKSILDALNSLKENAIGTMTTILWGAMQSLNPGFSEKDALAMFDNYIDAGNKFEDVIKVIGDVLEVSGFFGKGQE